MGFSKLRKMHVVAIGCVVCVIIAAGMYFLAIGKGKERLAAATKRYEAVATTGTEQNVAAKEADYVQAVQEAANAENTLNRYFAAKMPYLDLRDRKQGMIALWQEQSLNLGPLLVNWIERSGVTVDASTSITIPAPPANPNDLSSDPLAPMVIPLGKIRVTGSFKQILSHLRKWNQCSRLVMIDNPTVTGVSPNLACEYDATVYIFPRYPASAETVAMAGVPGMGTGGMAGGAGLPGGVGPVPSAGVPMPGGGGPVPSPGVPMPGGGTVPPTQR